jgi:hypothetical protein
MNSDPFAGSLVFRVIGYATLAFGLWQQWRERRPRAWAQVTGTVLACRTEKQYTRSGSCEYVTGVEYEYSCGGQSFRSRRIRTSNYSLGTKRSAEVVSTRYPVGGT